MRNAKEVTYSKDDLAKYELEVRHERCEERKLHDKIDDVFCAMASAFGIDGSYNWYFNNAADGEIGRPMFDDNEVYDYMVETYSKHGDTRMETTEWSYKDSFPIEYLFMTRQEITDSIQCQIEKDQEATAKRTQVNEVRKSKKAAMKKAALAKLSDEDKRILGLK